MMSSKAFQAVLVAMALGAGPVAMARDDHLQMSIADAVAKGVRENRISNDVKLYFGSQSHPDAKPIITVTTNRKTNAFNKTDKEACDWVFLSTILALQERARKEGADAVYNIHSVYKNTVHESETTYTCGAGSLMAGVALKGTIAKTK